LSKRWILLKRDTRLPTKRVKNIVVRANEFKGIYYTDLAPQFVLEDERNKVLSRIFEESYGKWSKIAFRINKISPNINNIN